MTIYSPSFIALAMEWQFKIVCYNEYDLITIPPWIVTVPVIKDEYSLGCFNMVYEKYVRLHVNCYGSFILVKGA